MEIQKNEDKACCQSDTKLQECITNCLECYQTCTKTIQKCLLKGGKHADPTHISLLMSCARICVTSAELMMLGTKAHVETCGACASICEMCADDCEKVGDEMKCCIDTCRKCQESCENMAAH